MRHPRVLVVCRADRACEEVEPLREVADIVLVRTSEELRAALPGTEVMFLNDVRSTLIKEVGPGDLRWIQSSGLGVDALLTPAVLASGLTVTVARGVCERPIAEWVLTAILMFVKDMRTTFGLQLERKWLHRDTRPLRARRAVLLGAGPVGTEIALLLRAAGLTVDVVARNRRDDPVLGPVLGLQELDTVLTYADDVILALPLNASTRRIMDGERLARIAPGAHLVNVGRGGLVDESALIGALESGRLAWASLDVFDVEPLPPDHPFWAMPQVLVSPHMSGDLVGWRDDVVRLFADNLRRWQRGEPLNHVVDLNQHPV